MDDPPLKSEGDRFSAIVDTELRHHVLEMDFHGSLRASNHAGDFFIAKSFRGEVKNLDFSFREIDPWREFREPASSERGASKFELAPSATASFFRGAVE